MAWTQDDGWVWVFGCLDHYTAEAWTHVAKVGTRFAALQPLYDAIIDRFGSLTADIARGISVRHDWGSQYRSHHFTGSLHWLGMADDPAYPANPRATAASSGGCAPSKNSACGPASTATSTTFARRSQPSPTPTTTSGSSSGSVTAHHEKPTPIRSHHRRRDRDGICPRNRVRLTPHRGTRSGEAPGAVNACASRTFIQEGTGTAPWSSRPRSELPRVMPVGQTVHDPRRLRAAPRRAARARQRAVWCRV